MATHFQNLSPDYPVFGVLVTRANRDQAASEALKWIAGGVRSDQGTAVLDAIELLDDSGKLSPRKSRYAKHVLKLLDAKQGKVLNRDELVKKEAGIAYWTKFRLEPEFLVVALAALVHAGAAVLKLPNRKFDARDINELSRTPVTELVEFKHVERPKGFPLEVLKKLFAMLDLPEGLLPNESTRDQAVKDLQVEVDNRLARTVRVQVKLKDGITFWGSPVPSETEHSEWTAQIGQTKKFLESLQVFDTVGKLNNFHYSAEELDAEGLGFARLSDIELLAGLISETSVLTGYLSTASAVLPQKHEWQELARVAKEELLDELRMPARRTSGGFRGKLIRRLKGLKSSYQDVYLELHRKAYLSAEEDRRKAELLADYRLAQLRQLNKVDIMPHSELASFETTLLGLPTCFALSRNDLKESAVCPYDKYRPADAPLSFLGVSEILAGLGDRLDLLVQNWTSTLLVNLEDPTVEPNIELLSNRVGKRDLERFLRTRTLPERISSDFVEVVQEVLSGLEKVSVDGDSICEALVEGGMPCTVDDIKCRFADYLTERSTDKDPNKVRVVVE